MMASSFDRWEKDPFFTAAEEVQESADRLEPVNIACFCMQILIFLLIVCNCVLLRALRYITFGSEKKCRDFKFNVFSDHILLINA